MKLDIVIPVYNQGDYLLRCLNSIRQASEFGPMTFVRIVDSGSQENIKAIFDSFIQDGGRGSFTRLEKNQGVTIPWNIGLRQFLEGNAEVVCISNSDVIYGDGSLDYCARAAHERGAAFPFSNQRGPLPADFQQEAARRGQRGYDPSTLVDTGGFAGWSFFLSRATVEKVGLFDEQFTLWYQDTDYHCRLRDAGIIPWEVRCCYLHHFESRTILSMPEKFNCFGWRQEDEKRFFKKWPK